MFYNIYFSLTLHDFFCNFAVNLKDAMERVLSSVCRFAFGMLCITCCTILVTASGFMQVRNFKQEHYGGGPQNWVAVQDSLGRLYVGNRDAMMMFDGERWRKYYMPNHTAVRSLLYDHDSRRIYAGASEEFGYFAPDAASGELVYTSLVPTLGEGSPLFTEVWNIMKQGSTVWFQTDNHLLQYNGNNTTVIKASHRISSSSAIGGDIYVGLENGDVARLVGRVLRNISGAEILAGKKIKSILPAEGGIIIATPTDGLFIFNGQHVTPLECDINSFLKENQLFCAAVRGNDYVFGTVTCGAVVKNFLTGEVGYVNKDSGMQNNTVLYAAFDRIGNIWLCLDNGLDYGEYNSPVYNLIEASSDVGAGYASLKDGSRIFFGTNQGLYSAPYPFTSSPARLTLSRELMGQIWSITRAGKSFFVSGDAGVYQHMSGGFRRIPGLPGTYCVHALPSDTSKAVASSYDGFYLLMSEGDVWNLAGKIDGDYGVRGSFQADKDDNLWINHWLKGVYSMHLNIGEERFDRCRLYDDHDGLPSANNNMVSVLGQRAVVANPSGFYTLNPTDDRMMPDGQLKDIFGDATPRSLHVSDGKLVALGPEGLYLARMASDGTFNSSFLPVKSLNDRIVNGFEHVNYIDDQELIVSNQNGFWTIDPNKRNVDPWSPTPFVNAVYANRDSLVFVSSPDGRGDVALKLPYELNSLRFEYSCPEFRSVGGIRYSSFLENYDKEWSPVSEEPSREYTRLAEGKYILHLRAHNTYTDQVDETSFTFEIAPPWYRSVWAICFYIVLCMSAVGGVVYIVKRWKTNAERRMEDRKEEELLAMRAQAEQEALQKDFEIATLKSEQLEVDIRHKSSELSNATMNVIRKNEMLQDIASKISKIQASSDINHNVQRQLAAIQASIEENISHDDDWSTFNRNFDVVYGNYTKRLHEMYPQLTPADLRLCCYIKMGLSSKEIAPLINISFKSVEMARYRLRKKINLDGDVSLADYLANF